MANSTYKQGQHDANQGKGQKTPSEFKTDQERKDYQAGYNNTKK